MIDEDEVGLKEKPEDTRFISKKNDGLIASPFIIDFLATDNLPKVSSNIAQNHLSGL